MPAPYTSAQCCAHLLRWPWPKKYFFGEKYSPVGLFSAPVTLCQTVLARYLSLHMHDIAHSVPSPAGIFSLSMRSLLALPLPLYKSHFACLLTGDIQPYPSSATSLLGSLAGRHVGALSYPFQRRAQETQVGWHARAEDTSPPESRYLLSVTLGWH